MTDTIYARGRGFYWSGGIAETVTDQPQGGTERGRAVASARAKQAPQRREERSEPQPGERPGAFIVWVPVASHHHATRSIRD